MTTIIIRTLIVYAVLMIAMRLMGKRQIGELEVSDLVTTLLISEIASLPITDSSIPLANAVFPIIILITLEICSSALIVRFPKLKGMFTTRPSTLIKNGVFCRRAMISCRITVDELITELRQNGYSDVDQVLYAILEKNGKITVIPKAKYAQPTVKDLQLKAVESGIYHIVIDNGTVNRHGLLEVGLTQGQLDAKLRKVGSSISEVYLMMISDSGEERIILKKETL